MVWKARSHAAYQGYSHWRGPILMPVNVLLIRALLQFYLYYCDNFKTSVQPVRPNG
jgi:hypothetical protein